MAGLLTHSPARVIAQLVIDLGYGVAPDPRGPSAWSVYYGGLPDMPDEAMGVRLTTGLDDGTTQWDGVLQTWYGIQIRLRANDEDAGWDRVNPLATELHALTNRGVTVDGVAYLVSDTRLAREPESLGKAEQTSSRNLFAINLLASINLDE